MIILGDVIKEEKRRYYMDDSVWIVLCFVVAVVIYVIVKDHMNMRKATTGEDQERLKVAVAQAIPGEYGYRVAYGHHETIEHYGRKKITTYYCYGIAFDDHRIWVMSLHFEDDRIITGEPVLITQDQLGVVNTKIINDKEGNAIRVEVTLYDMNGKAFLDCLVEDNNTKDDRYHHVNIIQKEECNQFAKLMESIATKVNHDNADLKERVHTDQANMRTCTKYTILGIFFGVFFPPFGLFSSIKALQYANKLHDDKKHKDALLQSRIGIGVSIVCFLFEFGGLLILKLT